MVTMPSELIVRISSNLESGDKTVGISFEVLNSDGGVAIAMVMWGCVNNRQQIVKSKQQSQTEPVRRSRSLPSISVA